MQEFGHVIPWLEPVHGLEWSTNGSFVRDQLLARLGLEEDGIQAFQFVSSDRARGFAGGILSFARSPERFVDTRNLAAVETLEAIGAGYISCLQVLPSQQGAGIGDVLMRRALSVILTEHGSVWGVASNPRLLPWYRSLGATLRSPIENRDDLWIISWTT